MKVNITSPFQTFGGTYKTTDLVFRRTAKDGELLASSKVTPRNPRTPDQEATRRIQKAAVLHWGHMTLEQRTAWNRYAQL